MHQDQLREKLSELHLDSYAWAVRCCAGNVQAAEEVLQDTYVKVLRKNQGFQGQSSFKTWLFAIIRYTAADYSKARAKYQSLRIESLPEEYASSPTLSEEEDQDKRLQILFERALAELSPQQRQVLHLVFYQNCSIREASDIMNIQVGTARTHYERGKLRLRQVFSRLGIRQHMI